MHRLGEHDVDLAVMREIVEHSHNGPAVHLRLIDLLRAVIKPGRVAEANRIGGGEQAEGRMRANNTSLIEQGQAAARLQHALDHEHDIRTARVIFVEYERHIVLVGPGQNAVAEFRDLLALLEHDSVLADEIDARHMAVEVNAHTRPVQPRRDLLDMRGFAGAVIAGDDNPPVEGKAGQNGKGGFLVEEIIAVKIGHMGAACRIGRALHIRIDVENLADGNLDVRHCGRLGRRRHSSSMQLPVWKPADFGPQQAPGEHVPAARNGRRPHQTSLAARKVL